MLSMTGYGRAEYSENGINLVVEIRSVNNRNLDFNCKTPRAFMALEDTIRKVVQSHVKRGRVDLFVSFSDTREKNAEVEVDLNKAAAYVEVSKTIADKFGLDNDCLFVSLHHSV